MTELFNNFPYKLGKRAASYHPELLQFGHYRTTAPITVPKTFGHFGLIKTWGMLGNDTVGDCVIAGSDHETMMFNAEASRTVSFTTQNALSDYSAITGYNPDNPNSDQGTDVYTALQYRVNTGMIDEQGNRHKIAGFVGVELGNLKQLLEAAYLFGAVGIGIQVPQSAMDQFQAGKPWSVVSGSPIEGGHYVPVVGKPQAEAGYLEIVTWGTAWKMTESFFETYCDEAFAILSPEVFNQSGKDPEGFNLQELQADLNSV